MSKKLIILIGLSVIVVASVFFFRANNIGTSALWSLSDEGKWLLPLILVAALLDSINPCAFSILILTIAFLLSIGKARASVLRIGSFYILGIFAVYILIGLGILHTLHIFDTPHFMAKVGSILLIILGSINLINEYIPSFPIKLRIPHVAHRKMAELMDQASLPAAFMLGTLVGLCEFPCTGGPYLLVLGLLHDTATYVKGLGYLFLYNAIFILPLVVILLIASDQSLLAKVQSWQQREKASMRFVGGIAMILFGTLILLI